MSIPATCRNGHPVTETSRYKDGQCKLCHKANQSRWRLAHAHADAAYNKRWKQEHKAEEAERRKRWRANHLEQVRSRARRYYYAHQTERIGYARTYYTKRHETIKAKARLDYAKQPEVYKARWHNRRARLQGNGGDFTPRQWAHLVLAYGGICLCCAQRKPLTADHVIPLSKGGLIDINNIQPLCLSCNVRKGTKTTDYRLLCINPS